MRENRGSTQRQNHFVTVKLHTMQGNPTSGAKETEVGEMEYHPFIPPSGCLFAAHLALFVKGWIS
jgi:hypothetical protein